MNVPTPIRIGTAGWSIATRNAAPFPAAGSHLQRYGAVLSCVEIDSSFYKPHRRATYERWRDAVPAGFRFAVKLPKAITHDARFEGCGDALDAFLDQTGGLGGKLGVVLVQTAATLAFSGAAADFLRELAARTRAAIAVEPRHASWSGGDAVETLARLGIARVAAHPSRVPDDAEPGGARDLAYFRFHGAPRIYWSDYDAVARADIAARLGAAAAAHRDVWCIFDNTAGGHALPDALDVMRRLSARRDRGGRPGGRSVR